MIRILEKKVADKIAAGEVIDRPVSIVKELLENAIDAGADSIVLQIKNGGKTYIRVTDNGCGIKSEEVDIAFKRHATSKIFNENDLNSIETLGFRGEALASICAVSRVEVITKTKEAKIGCRLVINGSEILEKSMTGCPEGTTITVKDLFFNVPARKKFLSTDNGETRRIVDMVSWIALSYSDIRISFINGNNTVFTTQGKGNILNNIRTIYGSDIGRDLLPVDYSQGNFLLRGFVSNPGVSLASRSRQIFCINGRIVRSKVLEKAVDDAYREKLFHRRFPIAFIFLSMSADKLDVNIHPTKKEIRFDDNGEIQDFVSDGIKQALMVKEAVPPMEKKVVHEKMPSQEKQVDINNLLSTLRKKTTEVAETNIIPEPVYKPFDIDNIEVIGILFNTYILACDNDSLFLLDQHAAHERVFYERLLHQYDSATKMCQSLLIPLNFTVDTQVYVSETSWIDDVKAMGYDIENFGDKTYIVRQVPAFMDIAEAEAFLIELFREFHGRPDLSKRVTLDKIITKACKSAVKSGDCLTKEEIDALLKDIKGCVNPFSCPHGRPVFIRITKYEIERMFKRT